MLFLLTGFQLRALLERSKEFAFGDILSATLLVGSQTPDKTYYARDAAKNMVVTIDTAFGDELKRDADADVV